jgi:malonyl-CoA decarboxylase
MTEFERSTFEAARLVAQPALAAGDAERAIERCHVLLSDRGEVSGERLANEALAAYEALNGPSLDAFFTCLTHQFAPAPEAIAGALEAARKHPSPEALAALQVAMDPPRRELFRRLNLARGGTAALIEMRRRVLGGLGSRPEWAGISADLEHLLRSWLNGGFLELRRIDWHTPTPILENLIKYEAVHRVRDWADLRRRLQDDRRCFGFFHPSLPHDPLIFTELALTGELSARIQPILDPDSPVLDRKSRSFAVFYSISSCHDGLRGISFGNSLIRRVVDTLRHEYPRLRTFGTLSPIPGFRNWLAQAAKNGDGAAAAVSAVLADSNSFADAARSDEMGRTLLPLCATYLLTAKRGEEPADPVARFHLGNGARLERINWLGDMSPAGVARSGSLTANYLYRLSDVERNHRVYARDRRVVASRQVHLMALGELAIAS